MTTSGTVSSGKMREDMTASPPFRKISMLERSAQISTSFKFSTRQSLDSSCPVTQFFLVNRICFSSGSQVRTASPPWNRAETFPDGSGSVKCRKKVRSPGRRRTVQSPLRMSGTSSPFSCSSSFTGVWTSFPSMTLSSRGRVRQWMRGPPWKRLLPARRPCGTSMRTGSGVRPDLRRSGARKSRIRSLFLKSSDPGLYRQRIPPAH